MGATSTGPAFIAPISDNAADADADRSGFKAPKALIIGAVALLIVLLGFLGFHMFGSMETGAKTPEIAAEQFLGSVYSPDAAGIAATINPDEVEAWTNGFLKPLTEWIAEADPEDSDGTLNDAANSLRQFKNLSGLVDLEIDGGTPGTQPTYTYEFLGDDKTMARITLETLRLRVTFNADHPYTQDQALLVIEDGATTAHNFSHFAGETIEIRIQPTNNGSALIVRGSNGSTTANQLSRDDRSLIAIERDGRWYISPGYTLVEAASSYHGYSADYGKALRLIDSKTGGAGSPEDVIHDLFEFSKTFDSSELIDLVDPASLPYFHDYPVSAERNLQNRSPMDPFIEVIETDVQDWNNRKVVKVKKVAMTIHPETYVIDIATQCFTYTVDGEEEKECLGSTFADQLGVTESEWLDAAPDHIGLAVVERNGRWFLDPIGSVGYLGQLSTAISEKLPEGKDLQDIDLVDPAALLGSSTPVIQTVTFVTSFGTFEVDPVNGLAAIGVAPSRFTESQTGGGFTDSDGTRLILVEVNGDDISNLDSYQPEPPKFALVIEQTERHDTFPALVLRSEGPVSFTTSEIEVIDLVGESVSGTFNEAGHPILVQVDADAAAPFFC